MNFTREQEIRKVCGASMPAGVCEILDEAASNAEDRRNFCGEGRPEDGAILAAIRQHVEMLLAHDEEQAA